MIHSRTKKTTIKQSVTPDVAVTVNGPGETVASPQHFLFKSFTFVSAGEDFSWSQSESESENSSEKKNGATKTQWVFVFSPVLSCPPIGPLNYPSKGCFFKQKLQYRYCKKCYFDRKHYILYYIWLYLLTKWWIKKYKIISSSYMTS